MKIFYKTDKVLELHLNNSNLLENKLAEVKLLGDAQLHTDSVLFGADAINNIALITKQKNLYYHADFFSNGYPITFTYDIGFICNIDGFTLIGFDQENYKISEFEVYASKEKEDLYKEENKYAHFISKKVIPNDNTRYKGTIGGVDIAALFRANSIRYFGLKVIKANALDDIIRIVNMSVFSNEITSNSFKDSQTNYSLKVQTHETINDNFYSLGGNIIPCHLMPEQLSHGYTNEFFEVEKSLLKHLKLNVARLWFQIDWITDNKNNYENHIYTFNSEKFEAVCKYIEALKDAGTEIELNFGWKTDEKVAEWFSHPMAKNKNSAAPHNLSLFANACAETLYELTVRRNFKNIKYITFFNEPSPANDFGTSLISNEQSFYNNVKYWHEMATKVRQKLSKKNIMNISIWGPENAPGRGQNHILKYTDALEKIVPSPIDVLTYHHYNYFSNEFEYTRNAQKLLFKDKPMVITEHAVYRKCFDNNYVQAFIDCANHGYSGLFIWCASTSQLPSPLNFSIGGSIANRNQLIRTQTHNIIKNINDGLAPVGTSWNEVSLITNFVPSHSKVLKTTGGNDDLRVAAFITPDNQYTIIVEANNTISQKDINIVFDVKINKHFFVYKHSAKNSCRNEFTNNFNGIIPPVYDELDVVDAFKYTIDENYNVICFTTIPPSPQVKIECVNPFILAGESFKLSASIVDGEGEIVWSRLSGKGIVDAYGVVTLDEDAKSGDMVAVKAAIKDSNIYSVAVVQCY